MRHIFAALLALAAAVLFVSLSSAQTPPAWELVFSPLDVQAGDTSALTVSIAPGQVVSETVTLTLAPGLQLVDVQASVGSYKDGVWTFTRPATEPATLLLRFAVLPTAQRAADVLVLADWRGGVRYGSFELHSPGDLGTFLPIVNQTP